MNARIDDLIVTRWGARFQGRQFSCAIGRAGIGEKSGEGDNITPRGVWRLKQIWHRPDRVSMARETLPGFPITPGDVWSDDPKDNNYNAHRHAFGTYPFGHEAMRRPDPIYDLLAVTDFNWPDAVSGAGSAIFLHVWRKPRHPTAGCVAFDLSDLSYILANWRPWSRLIVR
ncbi:MAG: L,D-transpeptidase family protein [Pseudomonadota bacterium]